MESKKNRNKIKEARKEKLEIDQNIMEMVKDFHSKFVGLKDEENITVCTGHS